MASCPFFLLIIVKLTKHFQDEFAWCMFSVDDIVIILVDDTRKENFQVKGWHELQNQVLRISRMKTKYMKYSFSKTARMSKYYILMVKKHSRHFYNLGSIIHQDCEIAEEVHWIKVGRLMEWYWSFMWTKYPWNWRKILYDRKKNSYILCIGVLGN